jgi:SPP1 gp7 family putative phage head morphogenesis protein
LYDYKILRITNTEIHKSAIQLKLLKWKQMGIKYVKYLAHMDDRVRPTHKKLNNKIFTIDDALKLEEWKEINCRCNFKPIIM